MFYTMETLTVFEVDAFVEKVRQALAEWDMGCPFSKLVGSSPVDPRGHPIVCYNGELCIYWCPENTQSSFFYPFPCFEKVSCPCYHCSEC